MLTEEIAGVSFVPMRRAGRTCPRSCAWLVVLAAVCLALSGCGDPPIRTVRTPPDKWGVYWESRVKGGETLNIIMRQVGQEQAIRLPLYTYGLRMTDTTETYHVKIMAVGSNPMWGPCEYEVLLLHLRPLREVARWRMTDDPIRAACKDLEREKISRADHAAITEDGSILAVTRFLPEPPGENTSMRIIITLWEARTGKLLPQILEVPPPSAEARAVMAQCPNLWRYDSETLQFSSDGRYLTVVMGWDRDAKDPRIPPRRPPESVHTFPIQAPDTSRRRR